MRGHDEHQENMFSYISSEKRVPLDHPLRRVRAMTDRALQVLSPKFSELYSHQGRPSIAPEQLYYNLLFRWFVGLNIDEPVWDVTVFTKNRERLLEGNIAQAFFDQVLAQANGHGLLSDEHFTVDGTLLEAR